MQAMKPPTGPAQEGPLKPLLTYSYDAASNRTQAAGSAGGLVSSSYDARNRLSVRALHNTTQDLRIDLTYTSRGDLATLDRYDDHQAMVFVGDASYAYDALRRLTTLYQDDSGSLVVSAYVYTYDAASQLIGESHHGQLHGYSYDLAGQLISAEHTGQSDEAYVYDANGNRTGSGYVVGPNNQIASDGAFTYAYDAEGNLIEKTEVASGVTTTFTYDHPNRLIRI